MRHQVVRLGLIQPLLDGALDAHQSGAELVLGQFADRTHTAITKVVDVVDLAATVAQFDQDADHVDNVLIRQGAFAFETLAPDTAVELHAAHGRQVVALLRIEQAVEQGFDRVLGGRFAGAHHPVDGNPRRQLIASLIDAQRRREIGAAVQIVHVERLEYIDTGLGESGNQVFGQFVIGIGQDLAGLGVDDVLSHDAADEVIHRHNDFLDAGLSQVANVFRGDALVLGDNHLARLVDDIELGHFAAQALGHHLELNSLLGKLEGIELEEGRQDLFGR